MTRTTSVTLCTCIFGSLGLARSCHKGLSRSDRGWGQINVSPRAGHAYSPLHSHSTDKRRVYDSIRLPHIFLGSPGACACNVYQALSPPPLEGPGYEAKVVHVDFLLQFLCLYHSSHVSIVRKEDAPCRQVVRLSLPSQSPGS